MTNQIITHTLQFKKPSGTSRGVLTTKRSWYPVVTEAEQVVAIGEASIIDGLSIDPTETLEDEIKRLNGSGLDSSDNYPAAAFSVEILRRGVETNGPFELWDSPFLMGEEGIAINGLIWMAPKADMIHQIKEKIDQGFRCIKMKIGAIDFEDEIDVLQYVRDLFTVDDIELRVDANGAFRPDEALDNLSRLAQLHIHSIEQPIRAKQWDEMASLCQQSPLPIALDEELIGINGLEEKRQLIQHIQPDYIILKPSLLGGWAASESWMDIADEYNVGYWITSALESNIGLNAIAQWTALQAIQIPQGLGTGGLFSNNVSSPLTIRDGHLWYDRERRWDLSVLSL
ncbi:MAG: o-succinylbenzoate synthase [Bacteroidota bacterium]